MQLQFLFCAIARSFSNFSFLRRSRTAFPANNPLRIILSFFSPLEATVEYFRRDIYTLDVLTNCKRRTEQRREMVTQGAAIFTMPTTLCGKMAHLPVTAG